MRIRQKLLTAAIILTAAAGAVAGIRNSHVHQFPPPDFAYVEKVIPITGAYTASAPKVVQIKTTADWWIEAIEAVSRTMSGTITQFTIDLYNNDNICIAHAIDLYGTGLAYAGTFTTAEQIRKLKPLFIKSGHTFRVDLELDGSDTPTVNDITLKVLYRTPVGQE